MIRFWKEVRVGHIIWKERGFLNAVTINKSHREPWSGLYFLPSELELVIKSCLYVRDGQTWDGTTIFPMSNV